MAKCVRCSMDDDSPELDHVHIGKLASGTDVFEWKHKTIEGCLRSLGTAVSLLREQDD